MNYGMTVRTPLPFAEAAARVSDALKAQGFGVLTEIDVRATLRDKLGQDMEDYLILGACNPSLAHRALAIDPSIGLLLPCNVVVRTQAGQTIIEALDPQTMVTVTGQPPLQPIADEATSRLRTALHSLQGPRDTSRTPVPASGRLMPGTSRERLRTYCSASTRALPGR